MKKNIIIGILIMATLTLAGLSIYQFKQIQVYQAQVAKSKVQLQESNEALQRCTNAQLDDSLLQNIEHDITSQPMVNHWLFVKSSLTDTSSGLPKSERIKQIIGYLSGRLLVLETPQDLSILADQNTSTDEVKKIAKKLADSNEKKQQSTAFKEGLNKGTDDAFLQLYNQLKAMQKTKPSSH
ncbi:MAG: hypothetical protein PUP46_01235 [Endozoicomonas sp. (ex Botrylloides leachii)]|nr:hypothetical protein [Endozoicomonas sp. (ex Botrylloides leachii)]